MRDDVANPNQRMEIASQAAESRLQEIQVRENSVDVNIAQMKETAAQWYQHILQEIDAIGSKKVCLFTFRSTGLLIK